MSDGDADRSTFRRFPWAPALLCAASLAMAAWTWMRYSYCWDIALRDLPPRSKGDDLEPACPVAFSSPVDFERIREELSRRAWPEALGNHWVRDRYVRVKGCVTSSSRTVGILRDDGTVEPGFWTVTVSDGTGEVRALLSCSRENPPREGERMEFRGRMVLSSDWWMDGRISRPLSMDSCAGRWQPASVAGLVVAAMGAFVFVLYLRSWLRARREAPMAADVPADAAAHGTDLRGGP